MGEVAQPAKDSVSSHGRDVQRIRPTRSSLGTRVLQKRQVPRKQERQPPQTSPIQQERARQPELLDVARPTGGMYPALKTYDNTHALRYCDLAAEIYSQVKEMLDD